MNIKIFLAATAINILLSGCVTPPPRLDPFSGNEAGSFTMSPERALAVDAFIESKTGNGTSASAAFPGLSLAIVLSQNTKNAIAYADKANDWGRNTLYTVKPLEDMLAQLRANFKSVTKVESASQAKTQGLDLVGMLDFYNSVPWGPVGDIQIDETIIFRDPEGNQIDNISASERKGMRAFPNVGNDLRRQFLANLSTSAPLKSYVKDRAAKANALAVTEAAARASAQAAAQAATEKDRRDFDAAVRSYRAATLKPSLPEQARKYKVQAEDAINEKDFNAADGLFRKALAIAPWWPEGHFNLALVLGETGDPSGAIVEMKRYLSLVPNAPDARDAQDKIYAWERKTE